MCILLNLYYNFPLHLLFDFLLFNCLSKELKTFRKLKEFSHGHKNWTNYVCNSTREPLECIKIEEIRTHSGLAKLFPTHTHSTHLCLCLGPGAYSGHLSPSTCFTPLAHYANHHQSKPNIIELKRKLIKCTSATLLQPIPPPPFPFNHLC